MEITVAIAAPRIPIFNPNMNITQINFLKYLYSPMQSNYSDDEFYNMLKDDTTINKIQSNVKNLSMDFLLEASKQYINYKLGNIFNS